MFILSYYFNAFPKRYVIFNFLRRFFGFGIKPCGIFINFAVNDNIVIARRTFPAADGVRLRRQEVFPINTGGGEIVITFDDDCLVGFS